MTINVLDGSIEFEHLRLSPGFRLETLEQSEFSKSIRLMSSSGKAKTYSLKPVSLDGRSFAALLSFDGGKLLQVQLSHLLEPEPDWSSWSEESEIRRKERHDDLLRRSVPGVGSTHGEK